MNLAPSMGETAAAGIRREEWIYRVRYGLVVALAAGTVVALCVYLILGVTWFNRPFIGFMLSHTMVITNAQPTNPESWPGLDMNRMRARDRIVAVNELVLPANDYGQAQRLLREELESLQFDEALRVQYARRIADGREVQRIVTYPASRLPDSDFLVFFLIPLGSALVVLIAGLTMLTQRPRSQGTLVASGTCFTLALYMMGIMDPVTTHRLTPLWYIAGPLLGGFAVLLGLIFPTRLPVVYRFPWLRVVPLTLAVVIATISLSLGLNPDQPRGYFLANQISSVTGLAGVMLLVVLTIFQRQQASTRHVRDQSGMLLVGLALAVTPALMWLLGQIAQIFNPSFVLPINIEVTMLFMMIPAVALAIGVMQFRRIEADNLISEMTTYSLLVGMLVVGYFLLVLGTSLLALRLTPNNPLLVAATLFVVAVLFLPMRNRLQRRVDTIYFQTRYNYQEMVEDFSQKLSRMKTKNEIITAYRDILDDSLAPISMFIFLPEVQGEDYMPFGEPEPETHIFFAADSGVADLMRANDELVVLTPHKPWPPQLMPDRARLLILKPLILLGLNSRDNLNGIVAIGPPRSGRRVYNYEEMRFLSSVTSQMSIAIERALVIGSLEQRVRQLDVLRQVGQAANFDIGFNDLLELIYAQANRLIQADYFYIAMYDDAEDKNHLYFVFYLENDDRYEDKEQIPWNLGPDLYSEVLRSGQMRVIEDYGRVTGPGGDYEPITEGVTIKAWVGVPLIAQTRKLGVIAAGRAQPNNPFTRDQIRIFDNVAALAAAAIEKSRLFDEVNLRARQLGALNDISQKLAAAEGGKVEALLELITESAVDILDAEAGSLLLATNEEAEEFEFRVAIGGNSNDLIGTRLPGNYGLIGEVVRTGQPAISNNTRQDERWAGEVAKTGTFHTTSVLAVPLIAKEHTIGVLEVLNKRGGKPYAPEEVELMTTFAGQAAIAIENARLFQMTGSQLNQRLEELQTLEQIDRELARTLELNRVAEIAIKWAVVNSGAVAAALGEVVNGNQLRILAKYGYKEHESPDGSDGMFWPLDRGIVKRVMRTGVPDLADVGIDPDYVPSLSGAISQITVPMVSGEEIIAIMVLETNHQPRFNLLDLEFVKRLAERASIALTNAQLYEDIMRAAETKSEFVGFAAHELKNPLTSIKGYTSLLMSPMFDAMTQDQRRDYLGVINNNAERMQSIIDDMRDIARSDAGKFTLELKPLHFGVVVTETQASFMQQIGDKQQTFVNDVPDDLPLVMGDRQKLVQVLVNLVSNAHKYSPEGATITVRARVVPNYRNRREHLVGPRVHIAVQDTGIGMTEDDQKQLFRVDYFRSSNQKAREQKGTGLGMIITGRIIDAHEGEIWVESQLDVGTTFHFVLPLAPEMPKESQPEAVTDTHRAPTQHRIDREKLLRLANGSSANGAEREREVSDETTTQSEGESASD